MVFSLQEENKVLSFQRCWVPSLILTGAIGSWRVCISPGLLFLCRAKSSGPQVTVMFLCSLLAAYQKWVSSKLWCIVSWVMPQNPFCWITRSFVCHTGLGEVLPSNRYALAVHFLSTACLSILKYTVIAITTPGNKGENISCISEELLLKSHIGPGKSK